MVIKIFVYWIVCYIVGYAVLLCCLDGIIFIGGIGENLSLICCLVMEYLVVLGLEIDIEMNNCFNFCGEWIVFSENVCVICVVILINEEKMIVLDVIYLGKVNVFVEFV